MFTLYNKDLNIYEIIMIILNNKEHTHTHTLHFVEFIENFTHNKVSFVVIISAIMTTHEAGAPAAMYVQPEVLRALTASTDAL